MTPQSVSPVPSALSSAATSQISSDHQRDGDAQVTRALAGMNLSAMNGESLPVPPTSAAGSGAASAAASSNTPSTTPPTNTNANANAAAKPTRPNMVNRISRIFTAKSLPKDQPVDSQGHISDSSSDGAKAPTSNGKTGDKPSSKPSSRAPSRQTSTKGDDREKKPKSVTGKDAKDTPASHHKRFEMNPEGLHAHHLKSARRQEKLTDLLRDMLGGGRKKDDQGDDQQQLSLMSTWIDQFKTERDKLAADKKGGPNATASLVDKYGKCQEIVGRGAFGIVRISHKVDPRDHKMEQLYAVKEFRRRPQETAKKYQKRLTSEFCISSSLRHPNVIHTLDLLQDAKGDYCEVMEYCAGGDLYTLVLAAGKLEVAEADCLFKQLMRGVEYMHEMGVAHRDLKPENLLLTNHGALKITDFGNGECFRMAWEEEAHMTAGLCGSAPYIAPEEYVEKEFDPRAVDLWAVGVIYMAMRTGRHLWRVARKDEDEFYKRYLEGRKHEDGYAPIETLHRVRIPSLVFFL